MSIWQWTLELVLIVLLAATLFYALRLERSIAILRKDRGALSDVLAAIRTALDDADRGIQTLQGMAEGTGRALHQEVEAAAAAQQDMRYLLERLEGVAARVEGVIKTGRGAIAEEPGQPKSPPPYSRAERDLIKVLRLTK